MVAAARQSRLATVGWLIVLVGSGLLVFQGATWYISGPQTALENIAGRTTLDPDEFRQGVPSAFDVIAIVTRTQAVYGAALGLLTMIVAWQGYRHGASGAWGASWVVVAAVAAAGLSFVLANGASVGLMYLGFAVVLLVGLALAGWGGSR